MRQWAKILTSSRQLFRKSSMPLTCSLRLQGAPLSPPKIRGKQIHHSHCVRHHKGVFICSQCGFYSTLTLKKLALPCLKQRTLGSQTFLNRYERGDYPKPNETWPGPSSELASGLIWSPLWANQ